MICPRWRRPPWRLARRAHLAYVQVLALACLAWTAVAPQATATPAAGTPSSVAGSLTETPPQIRQAPLSPAAAWATSYLMNAVFLAEYDAVVAALPSRHETPETFYATAAGRGLWRRAVFATATAASKRQSLPLAQHARGLLREQARLLADLKSAPKADQALARAVALAGPKAPLSPPSSSSVLATWTEPAVQGRWRALAPAYALPLPSCNLASTTHTYTERLARLTADGHALTAAEVLAPLRGWDASKLRCLAFAVTWSGQVDSLPLLVALRQAGQPLARDVALDALTAVRYLEHAQYPEALALLLDLVDLEPGFRLPYEAVQRIYSIRQKGGGAVAISGF